MFNLVSSKLIQVQKERDFFLINFLFSVGIAIASLFIISLMLYGSRTPEFWRVGLGIIILVLIMLYRSSVAISFGTNLKEINLQLLTNKTIVSCIILFAVDIILISYAIFYYQVKESIPADTLDMILAPIIIIAIISLVFVGIENIVYSFGIGVIALSLFVNPGDVHHTMGEFVLFYSFGSSLAFSSFYLLPGILLGVGFDKYLHSKDQNIKIIRILLLSLIPLVIIFLLHMGLFYYVFTNWGSL